MAAIDTDATPGTTPMRQPLENMRDAKSNYGPIIYRKGPSVLRALEYKIGAEAFRAGSKLFLERHAYACGDWHDLRDALEEALGGRGLARATTARPGSRARACPSSRAPSRRRTTPTPAS